MLSLSTASFEVRWDIEGGVHPAVAIQHSTIHSSSTNVTSDGITKELFAGGNDRAGDKNGSGDLVEAFE